LIFSVPVFIQVAKGDKQEFRYLGLPLPATGLDKF
jgi:hypothetical protein